MASTMPSSSSCPSKKGARNHCMPYMKHQAKLKLVVFTNISKIRASIRADSDSRNTLNLPEKRSPRTRYQHLPAKRSQTFSSFSSLVSSSSSSSASSLLSPSFAAFSSASSASLLRMIWSFKRRMPIAEKKRHTETSSMTEACMRVCLKTSSPSSPSSFGKLPPTKKRMVETHRKDMKSPKKSFSPSSTCSSANSRSLSGFLPSTNWTKLNLWTKRKGTERGLRMHLRAKLTNTMRVLYQKAARGISRAHRQGLSLYQSVFILMPQPARPANPVVWARKRQHFMRVCVCSKLGL
mmetsp:Transcript_19759/g.59617  ORF Transcript_19759/g.59617 Transcript_19759/m.59617 type:complete len:294 (-) Transcript_19759:238-1119(-)